jgi:Flp pilus assembly protein TadG
VTGGSQTPSTSTVYVTASASDAFKFARIAPETFTDWDPVIETATVMARRQAVVFTPVQLPVTASEASSSEREPVKTATMS